MHIKRNRWDINILNVVIFKRRSYININSILTPPKKHKDCWNLRAIWYSINSSQNEQRAALTTKQSGYFQKSILAQLPKPFCTQIGGLLSTSSTHLFNFNKYKIDLHFESTTDRSLAYECVRFAMKTFDKFPRKLQINRLNILAAQCQKVSCNALSLAKCILRPLQNKNSTTLFPFWSFEYGLKLQALSS